MILFVLKYLLPVAVCYYVVVLWHNLRHIPGPSLAKFTDLYRFISVLNRNPHNEQLQLHRRYGDLVRLGPNMISVSGPDYIPQIYGIGKGLVKSEFYSCFQNIVNGRRTASLVAMTDESEHARTKRQVAHAYSLSTLVEFESFVDSTTETLLSELGTRFAGSDNMCDLGDWLQFYAFDVIGELTFSKRLGFIESGEDVGSIIHNIGANFNYFSVLGQMPWLDSCLGKNPLYVKYFRKSVTSPILRFAQRLLSERLQEEREKKEPNGEDEHHRKDFLSRFLQVRKESPEPMSDGQILSYLFMNINAGSDTIASTLRAIFYNLLTHPSTLNKLIDELSAAHANHTLTLPSPTWHETQSPATTPYLCAVIKEGLRINPALSLPLERITPTEGLTLTTSTSPTTSIHIPGHTIIGINPYVIQRDYRIFGPDADDWNPDRWLNLPDDRHRHMDNHILAFGAGKRSCMGKNIALLELHKLVPAVLMRFRLELVNDGRDWRVSNGWALNQTGLKVRISERTSVA